MTSISDSQIIVILLSVFITSILALRLGKRVISINDLNH